MEREKKERRKRREKKKYIESLQFNSFRWHGLPELRFRRAGGRKTLSL
jgi:hypothetical protein